MVGGWTNPFEKYARQNGCIYLPQMKELGVKINKNIWVATTQYIWVSPHVTNLSSAIYRGPL